jgi:hypothetical protein
MFAGATELAPPSVPLQNVTMEMAIILVPNAAIPHGLLAIAGGPVSSLSRIRETAHRNSCDTKFLEVVNQLPGLRFRQKGG